MSKNARSLQSLCWRSGKIHPVSRSGSFQNLPDWLLTEGLSFHKISFKSINNFLRYTTDRRTDGVSHSQYLCTTPLVEVIVIDHTAIIFLSMQQRLWVTLNILLSSRALTHGTGVQHSMRPVEAMSVARATCHSTFKKLARLMFQAHI